ncbi:DUF3899 domain-containing protein [Staphylococcus epidermidis]|uniref:DUF3899 domain-containing protein n=1 Tax=Staphylococcus epidermidis TaxID=1282 RepID=UPI00124D4B81|nr:DUF3899 domain-containing protein [Staphylococcus epidermidis]KAB2285758.1 DUF3899 domain-containing protein [Staphylococcus epidermidis]
MLYGLFTFTQLYGLYLWLFYSNHFINLINILFYTSFIIFIIAFLILLIQEGIFDATSFGFRRLKYQLSSTKRKRMMKNDHFFNPQKVKKESYIISPWVVPTLIINLTYIIVSIGVSLLI